LREKDDRQYVFIAIIADNSVSIIHSINSVVCLLIRPPPVASRIADKSLEVVKTQGGDKAVFIAAGHGAWGTGIPV
jgi:hypothetical protein